MSFDFKKEFKEYYMPPKKPTIVTVPEMNYIAVRGKGNPNDENGEYKQTIGMLYSIAFTLKMSYKTDYKIDGYFQYVVPPLEGLWWQEGINGVDYSDKDSFNFISMIRLPDFVKKSDFDWAVESVQKKKGTDLSAAEFFTYNEGLCVQCMHIGPYDNEPETIKNMNVFGKENGYRLDFESGRLHHEIYLSDPRKCDISRLRTVIREPIASE